MGRRTMCLVAACFTTSAVLMITSAPTFADAAAGRKLAQQRCAVCHGIDGLAKMPIAPHLAGENEVYIQTQLKAFRTGKRVHEMMSVVAKELSDDQIADLSAWYASIKISVTMPP